MAVKSKTVAVSGYFNPLHVGHVRMLQAAKNLGDKLIVIVNSDKQVALKGSVPFMPEKERMAIMRALRCVDDVVLSIDEDRTVRQTIRMIRPDIFAKGGDSNNRNVPELEMCMDLGIHVVFGCGGDKIQSSSWLINKAKTT